MYYGLWVVFCVFFFYLNMGRACCSTAQGCHSHEVPGLVMQMVQGQALYLRWLGEGMAEKAVPSP